MQAHYDTLGAAQADGWITLVEVREIGQGRGIDLGYRAWSPATNRLWITVNGKVAVVSTQTVRLTHTEGHEGPHATLVRRAALEAVLADKQRRSHT